MKKLIFISVLSIIISNAFCQNYNRFYEENQKTEFTYNDSVKVYNYLLKYSTEEDIDTLTLSFNYSDFNQILKSVKRIKIAEYSAGIILGSAFIVFNSGTGESDYYAYSTFFLAGVTSYIIIRKNQKKIENIINRY